MSPSACSSSRVTTRTILGPLIVAPRALSTQRRLERVRESALFIGGRLEPGPRPDPMRGWNRATDNCWAPQLPGARRSKMSLPVPRGIALDREAEMAGSPVCDGEVDAERVSVVRTHRFIAKT